MVFNSLVFLGFFICTAVIYLLLPVRFQNIFLLFAGLLFYIYGAVWFALLLVISILFSYLIARNIHKAEDLQHRKLYLSIGIILHVLVLFTFKYYSLFTTSISSAIGISNTPQGAPSLLFPLGISFYTFQIIGYYIDLFNRKCEFEQNLVHHILFFSFFPQITAGPINRVGELMPQFRQPHRFHYGRTVEGLQRFLIGAFKKVVVADGLAIFVNGVYNNLEQYKGPILLLIVIFYAIEIYCDFSGYSDMAQGVATVLGFKMRENFNAPYLATNLSGFWQRWHMSLTSWLNDYIFIPLTWSRWANRLFYRNNPDRKPVILLNICIVFAISGLWHGSTINFLLWGLLHGLFRVLEEVLKKKRKKQPQTSKFPIFFGRVYVFFVSAFTHIFFRARTLQDAMYIIRSIFTSISLKLFRDQMFELAGNHISNTKLYFTFLFSTLFIGIIISALIDHKIDGTLRSGTLNLNVLSSLSMRKRWISYWVLAILTVFYYLMANTGISGAIQFIYAGY